MRYAIVAKQDDNSKAVVSRIQTRLKEQGCQENAAHPQLVICVGGDGTLLYGVHRYMDAINDLLFLGIHTGTLGFFTDYTEDELETCLQDIVTKTPAVFSSPLLQIQADVIDEPLYALNEMRIENVIRSQSMDVFVDGEYFENCRGSGICLSTQAGSTAYNRSLKGAVIDSGLSLLQLAEITPIQHSKHRSLGNPYIMKEDRRITIVSESFDGAMLCYDHKALPIDKAKKIEAQMSDKYVRFARYRPYSYLKRLKNLY